MSYTSADLRCEEGTALASVIIIVTIITVLVGVVLGARVLHQRLVQRDVDRLQARYAAESGVYVAMATLSSDLTAQESVFRVPGGHPCSVRVVPFGGWVRIESATQVHGEPYTVGAVVGMQPLPELQHSLLLGDERSSMTVTGETTIRGPVLVGPRGITTASLKGKPFTGHLTESVTLRPDVRLPPFEERIYEAAAEKSLRLASVLSSSTSELGPAPSSGLVSLLYEDLPYASGLAASGPGSKVFFAQDDLILSEADQSRWNGPVTVVTDGDLTLAGRLRYEPGSRFIARGTVQVEGKVEGHGGYFFGQRGVIIQGQARVGGQFFSDRQVTVREQSRLTYPTVLTVTRAEGKLRLRDQAAVDGLILYPYARSAGQVGYSISTSKGVRVRGAIYSEGSIEVQGVVHGSISARRFGFYESPTHYVNWIRNIEVDIGERPEPFVVPYGFDPVGSPAVVYWYDVERV